MAKKRVYKATVRGYEIKVRDYGYTSRAPVGVLVSGTRLGECVNLFGEPCYFYASHDAYSMEEGIKLAYQIIDNLTLPPRPGDPLINLVSGASMGSTG